MKPHLLDMTIGRLRRFLAEAGEKPFRADQLADWVFAKSVTDPAQMTNVPAGVSERLAILTSRVVGQADSSDGCIKLLLELHDGPRIETVLIPARRRVTACVSTQAGCAMGCVFCASSLDGLARDLTGGEILEQIIHLQQVSGQKVTNVVFMGMGEPLANYDATIQAVRAIIDPQRFALSARRVTVSTVGLPERIRRLASEDLPITLAISLHAPNDALRRELMPVAAKYPIGEVIEAAEAFYQRRKREITLEYVLLGGINDSPVCAEALARIAHRLRCNVNLIPYNPVASLGYSRPTAVAVKAFETRLYRKAVNVHVRQPRGLDADAACGQLRRRIESQDSDAAETDNES